MSIFKPFLMSPLFYPYNIGIRLNPPSHLPPLPSSPPPTPPMTPPTQDEPVKVLYRSFFRDTMNPPYSHTDRAIVHTSLLKTQQQRDKYKSKGLQWLRRHDSNTYPAILRNPTTGCMVELLSKPNLYTVHIDSPQAKKIICRVCYF